MINYRENEILIVNGLQEYLKKKGYDCPVVMANQTARIPPYPYISYTVTTPYVVEQGFYSKYQDGTRQKQIGQIWSFTAQSNDDVQAFNVAIAAHDWLSIAGDTYLNDNNIVVQNVGNITNRDNLLTIEYEYRCGFDVTFSLLNEVSREDCETAGYIETVEITTEINY